MTGAIRPPTGLPAEQNTQWVEESSRPRASRRNKNLQPMEESSRRQSFRRPKTSNGRRKHPCAGIRKGGSRSVTLDGNPDVECGGVLLSHTLSSAVPSPRPGLSFRVRKGTGRLTWAMTTAKPIQRPTTRIGRQNRNHATRPIPIVAVREPDNGREQKRFTGIVIVTTRNNAPCHPTKETTTGRDPTQQAGRTVCRVRPLVPVGSTPRGASTSGLSNTCSTCGLYYKDRSQQARASRPRRSSKPGPGG